MSGSNSCLSIAEQKAKILDYCAYKGLEPPTFIEDVAISGARTDRPGFEKLKEYIVNSRLSTVYVYDLSRLSRSTRDTIEFFDDYIQKYNINFVCLREDVDTSTAMGKFFLTIMASLAQLQRDQSSERMKNVRKYQRNNSIFGGGLSPYGQEVTSENKLTDSIQEVQVISIMKDLHDKGLTYNQIAVDLNLQEIPTKTGRGIWFPATVQKILRGC